MMHRKRMLGFVVVLTMLMVLMAGCFSKDEKAVLQGNVQEVVTMASTTVVVSEVYYDAEGNDTTGEWVELYNMSSSAVDISGWVLQDNYSTYTVPNGTTIAAETAIVIARNQSGFSALFGFNPDVAGLSLALGNSGDQIILKNGSTTIDYVAWENYASGWSISSSTGQTIERTDASVDTDTAADWTSSATPTPGTTTASGGGGTDPNPDPDPGTNPAPGVLKVHFIDVGQGDSILVQAPTGEVMMVDAGSYTADVETKVLSYLSSLQLAQIDVTVATHPHSDHIGSLDAVINTYPVGKAYDSGYDYTSISYDDYINAIQTNNVPFYLARRGDSFYLGAVLVEILSPTDSIVNSTTYTNDVSVVLRLTYGNYSVIMTGDASQTVETEILAQNYTVNSDMLKVGHHGSYTSSAPTFIDAVSPEVGAFIPVGADNPYGHPHAETLDTLNSRNITIYRADLDGDVVFSTDGSTHSVTTSK